MSLSPLAISGLLSTALGRPAREGARVVALHWLYELVAARSTWSIQAHASTGADSTTADDDDAARALHKTRVALRRLRATLKEHRVALDLTIGTRDARSLQRLQEATGAIRDRDVFRLWLEAQRAEDAPEHGAPADIAYADGVDASPSVAADIVAMTKHLNAVDTLLRRKHVARIQRECTRFDTHAVRMARRLANYRSPHRVGEDSVAVSFGTYLSEHVARSAEKIFRDAAHAATMREQPLLHRLRIRFKRQRAMLAPFIQTNPAIDAWFTSCTSAQDALGAMRDAVLFAERAKSIGALNLANHLRHEASAHFATFLEAWRDADHTRRPELLAACEALASASAIASTASPTNDSTPVAHPIEPAAAPSHALPMEIERKFLLHGLPPTAAVAPSIRIEQGWLPGNVLRERLRSATAVDGTVVHTRTIKLGAMGARIEVEEPTTPALFDALWPLTIDARIRKRRHMVPHNGRTWEIDVFLDRDLVLAEIELESESEHVELPDWLAPFVTKEVTHDPAYLNSVMAQRDVAAPDRSQRADHEWLRAV